MHAFDGGHCAVEGVAGRMASWALKDLGHINLARWCTQCSDLLPRIIDIDDIPHAQPRALLHSKRLLACDKARVSGKEPLMMIVLMSQHDLIDVRSGRLKAFDSELADGGEIPDRGKMEDGRPGFGALGRVRGVGTERRREWPKVR